MTGPRDDDLAAMLVSRADRMPAAACREVLASVREETRGPRGGAAFAVLPVAKTRGMNGAAGWAAMGLVAILVLAVMGGRLDTKPATPAGSAGGSASPAITSGASAVGPAATVGAPGIATVTADELRAGIADGTLDGRTVLLDGSLTVTPIRCLGDCQRLGVAGLDGVPVTYWATSSSAAQVRERIAAHPGASLIAFRVDGPELVLLGWPKQDPAAPLTVAQVEAGSTGVGGDDLAVVSGWLIPPPTAAECPPPRNPNTPCSRTTPLLSDAPPMPEGTSVYAQAINVGLDPSVAFGPGGAALAGPFLVRHMAYRGGDLPPYRVVASLSPANMVRVGTPPSSPTMTGEQLRAAVEDRSMDGRLVEITGYLQPSGGLCPADLPQPCTPFVILGLDDVAVTWDGQSWTPTRVDGDTSPAPSTADRLVVTPRDGRLVLLGRLVGDLEAPTSLEDIVSTAGRLQVRRDSLALAPVSGWLVVGGVHPCLASPDATPCPGLPPRLTDEQPYPEEILLGTLEVEVQVWSNAVGIDPAQVVTPGPFLYRMAVSSTCRDQGVVCGGGLSWSWEVMARYDIAGVTRVTLP